MGKGIGVKRETDRPTLKVLHHYLGTAWTSCELLLDRRRGQVDPAMTSVTPQLLSDVLAVQDRALVAFPFLFPSSL